VAILIISYINSRVLNKREQTRIREDVSKRFDVTLKKIEFIIFCHFTNFFIILYFFMIFLIYLSYLNSIEFIRATSVDTYQTHIDTNTSNTAY
jgi:hypothetical protein